ncbi:MAG: autotransporter, partial [Thermomicrobium sp.]|nr:autotransporter [Thermomicrobium sp.]
MQRSVILVVAVLFVVACSGSLSSVPTSISTAASPTPGPSCPPGSSSLVLTVGPGQSVTPSPQVVASYPAPYLYLGPLPSGPPAAPGWVLFVPHTFSPIPGAGSIVAGWLTVWMRPQVDSSADSINVTSPSSGNTYVDSLQVQSVLSQPWTTANYPSYVPVTMPLNSTSLAIVNSTGSLNVVVAYHAQVQAMSLTVCQANPTPTPTTTPVTPAGVATVSGPSTALDNGPVPTPSPTPLPTIVLQWTPKPLPTPTPTPKKSPGGSVVTVIPMPTPT